MMGVKIGVCCTDSRDVWFNSHAVQVFREKLTGGEHAFKFVPAVTVDVEAWELSLWILIDLGCVEHPSIADQFLTDAPKNCATLNQYKFGGGSITIIDDHLIFFGTSNGLGDYRMDLLKKGHAALKKMFKVSGVRYTRDSRVHDTETLTS